MRWGPFCPTVAGASNGIIGIDNQNQSTHVVHIYNNFIGGFATAGSANNAKMYGIRTTSISTTNIYHNTIYIPEMNNMAAPNSIAGIAFATAAASEAAPTGTTTVRNNIIKIDETTMTVYGIRRVLTNGTFTSDYNNVFINALNTSGNYGFDNATAQQTYANWIANTAYDDNSKNVDVTFTSSTDLHLSGGSNGDVNLAGVSGLGIATDIDGDARSGSFPYMGADEASTPVPVELVSFSAVAKGKNIELRWNTATETITVLMLNDSSPP